MARHVQRTKRALRRRLAGLSAVLCVSAVALPASAVEGPLSGDQVRALITGNTAIGPVRGRLYDFSFLASGEVIGSAGGNTDGGTWRIRDGNVYCHEWSTFFGGDERCYQWYDTGQGRYTLKNVDAFKILDLDVWRIRPGLD